MAGVATIAHSFFWEGLADEPLPSLESIPAIQKRRLSTVARMALAAASALRPRADIDYLIWASRFGDEHKTLTILQDIAQNEPPSPTAFSTSVHNAIAGLYSIIFKDTSPSISLAAAGQECIAALTEAEALLRTALVRTVMVVCYDDIPPEIYCSTDSCDRRYVWGLVLTRDARHSLRWQQSPPFEKDSLRTPQALKIARFWHSKATQLLHAGRLWQKE